MVSRAREDRPPTRLRARLLRWLGLPLILLAAIAGIAHLPAVQLAVVRTALAGVAHDLGCEIAVERVTANLVTGAVHARGLRIAMPRGSSPRGQVSIDTLDARVSMLRLVQGQVVLPELRTSSLKAHLGLDAERRLALPRLTRSELTTPGVPPAALPRVQVERLEVDGARVEIQLDRSERRLVLSGVRLTDSADLGALDGAGTLTVAEVALEGPRGRLEQHAELTWSLAGGDGRLDLDVTGPIGVDASLTFGGLPAQPTVAGQGTVKMPLELVGRILAPDAGLAGSLDARFTVSDAGGIELDLRATDTAFRGWTSRAISAHAAYREGMVTIGRLAVAIAGGLVEARGAARLSPALGDITLRADATSLDLARLVRPLAPEVRVAGRISGTVDLRAGAVELGAVVAGARARIEQVPGSSVPGNALRPVGRIDASFARGVLDIPRISLRDGPTTLTGHGAYDVDRGLWRGAFKAASPDVGPYLALARVAGRGALRCELDGEIGKDDVTAAGFAEVADLEVEGITLDRATLRLRLDDEKLEVLARDVASTGITSVSALAEITPVSRLPSALTADVGGITVRGTPWPDLHVSGSLGPQVVVDVVTADDQATLRLTRAPSGRVSLGAMLRGFDLERVRPFVATGVEGFAGEATGTLAATVSAGGELSSMEVVLSALVARFEGHELRAREPLVLHLAPPFVTVDNLALLVDGASLRGRGTVDLASRSLDVAIATHGLDLGAWGHLLGVTVAGRCEADLVMRGTLGAPGISGRVAVDDLRVDAFGAGALSAVFTDTQAAPPTARVEVSDAVWDGEGIGSGIVELSFGSDRVRVAGTLRDGRITLDGVAGLAPPWNLDVTTTLADLDLGDAAGVLELPAWLGGSLSGTVRLTGHADDLAGTTVAVDLPEVAVRFGESTLRGRIGLTVMDGSLRVAHSELSEPALTVRANGTLRLAKPKQAADDQVLDVQVHGSLATILAALPFLDHAEGSLDGSFMVEGSLEEPRLTGSLSVTDGALDGPWLPAPVEALEAHLDAADGVVTLASLTARLGSGTLEAKGRLLTRPQGAPIDGTLRLHDLDLTVTPTLWLSGDVDLSLGGMLDRPRVSGEIRIDEASFSPKLDALALLREATRHALAARPAGRAAEASSRVADLDLLVRVADQFEVVGPAVDATLSARLQVAGTTGRPVVTGGITVEGGNLVLFGSDFEIERGSLDFVDPAKVDPEVEVSAFTTKEGERITVAILGSASKPNLRLGSDSGRSQEEIVRLLVGSTGGPGSVVSADQFLTAAARSAVTALAERIAVSSDIEIVPFPATPEGEKLLFMVSKELGSGVIVRYGIPGESGGADVVEVVAELGGRGSARLRQNTDGTVSGGFRWRGTIR